MSRDRAIPIFTPGSPGVPSVRVDPHSAVPNYSVYDGSLLGAGPIAKGTMSNAPVGHPNHGKPYHGGIQMTGSDGKTFRMLHRLT